MVNKASIDEFVRKLADAMPSGARELRADVEKNFRAAVSSGLAKMDLVTREEFEVQSAVLARTRAKIDTLEKQVADLEALLNQAPKS